MCWNCSVVRPGDGPPTARVTAKYDYLVDGRFLQANEYADWESLSEWPGWDDRDSAGEPFFREASSDDAYRIGREAYLYGLRVVLRLPMSDPYLYPGRTRQIAERQFWQREDVAAERGWPRDWLERLIAITFPRHPA